MSVVYDISSIGRYGVGRIKNKQDMMGRGLMTKREHGKTIADMLQEDSLQLMIKVLILSLAFAALLLQMCVGGGAPQRRKHFHQYHHSADPFLLSTTKYLPERFEAASNGSQSSTPRVSTSLRTRLGRL